MNCRTLLAAGALAACLLSGCSATPSRDATLADGTLARLYRQQDGTASITTLSERNAQDCQIITKTSVTGRDTGDGIEYTTWYYIETYQPLSDSAEDARLAAVAFNDAKPDPAWKSEDPVQSRKTGITHGEGYSLSYNDETRTFAWTYTLEDPATLTYSLTDDSFTFEPVWSEEASGS